MHTRTERNKILSEGVVFERLLVGKTDTKEFIITNPGLLPIKWRLTGVDMLPAELQITPNAGEVAARTEVKVCLWVEGAVVCSCRCGI